MKRRIFAHPVFTALYEIMSKILIIDDEAQIRSLLARMMELEGYEVCQAGDCKAASQTTGDFNRPMWLCVMYFFRMEMG